MKKVVIFGGGTGLSNLLSGLKQQPLEITVAVTIADNGGSTGKIRNYYDVPAPGDIRRAVIALSKSEELKELMNYRFDENIQHHTIGNLILTALTDINDGKMSNAVKKYCEILGVESKILPITDESLDLCALFEDGTHVTGESQITKHPAKISEIYYQGFPQMNQEVVEAIKQADAIILSSGSLYTSIIPNIVFAQMYKLLSREDLKVIYVSNIVTQKGETDDFTVSDHLNALNKHLVNHHVDVVFSNNNYNVDHEIIQRYAQEHAKLVKIDQDNITSKIIEDNYLFVNSQGHLRHDVEKISKDIYAYLKEEL